MMCSIKPLHPLTAGGQTANTLLQDVCNCIHRPTRRYTMYGTSSNAFSVIMAVMKQIIGNDIVCMCGILCHASFAGEQLLNALTYLSSGVCKTVTASVDAPQAAVHGTMCDCVWYP